MQYRRSNFAGDAYFITVNLAERRYSALINKIDVLRDAILLVKSGRTFEIAAKDVLPDHFHLLMTLPPDDANFQAVVRSFIITFDVYVVHNILEKYDNKRPDPKALRATSRQPMDGCHTERGELHRCLSVISQHK